MVILSNAFTLLFKTPHGFIFKHIHNQPSLTPPFVHIQSGYDKRHCVFTVNPPRHLFLFTDDRLVECVAPNTLTNITLYYGDQEIHYKQLMFGYSVQPAALTFDLSTDELDSYAPDVDMFVHE